MESSIMKLNHGVMTLLPAVLTASLACATPAQAQSTAAAPDNASINVDQIIKYIRELKPHEG